MVSMWPLVLQIVSSLVLSSQICLATHGEPEISAFSIDSQRLLLGTNKSLAVSVKAVWKTPNATYSAFRIAVMNLESQSDTQSRPIGAMDYIELLVQQPEMTVENLRVESPYQLLIYAITGSSESRPMSFTFRTSSCLELSKFNMELCAPPPPDQLTYKHSAIDAIGWLNVTIQCVMKAAYQPYIVGYLVRYEQVVAFASLRRLNLSAIHRGSLFTKESEFSLALNAALDYVLVVQAVSAAGASKTKELRIRPLFPSSPAHAGTTANNEPATWNGITSSAHTRIMLVPLAIGCVLLTALCALLIVLRCKLRWLVNILMKLFSKQIEVAHAKETGREARKQMRTAKSLARSSSSEYVKLSVVEQNAASLLIDPDNLRVLEQLGEGAFANVFSAELRQGVRMSTVAVKSAKTAHAHQQNDGLRDELAIMSKLGCHDNVVRLLGWYTRGHSTHLVLEFCENGDLLNYLRKVRFTSDSDSDSLQSSNNSDSRRDQSLVHDSANDQHSLLLKFVRQILAAMCHLSSVAIVHRDLAARNVLLDCCMNVKLADFGLSRLLHDSDYYRKEAEEKVPYRWMAPESIATRTFSVKSDVWSFGVVVYEIYSLGAQPYAEMQLENLHRVITDGYRIPHSLMARCPLWLYEEVVTACWRLSPCARPSFENVHNNVLKHCLLSIANECGGYLSGDS